MLSKIFFKPPSSIYLRLRYSQNRGFKIVRCFEKSCFEKSRFGIVYLGKVYISRACFEKIRSYIFFCFFSLKYLDTVLILHNFLDYFFIIINQNLAFTFSIALLNTTDLKLIDNFETKTKTELVFK